MSGLSLLLLCAAIGAAQPDPKPAPKAPPKEPTLDELLGLPNAKPVPAPVNPAVPKPDDAVSPKAPQDPAKAELDRQLSSTEIGEAFEQAVSMMDQTAERLTGAGDIGLDTQRLQEDIIRKLDLLIDSAQKQQSKSKSKSKSKKDKDQQQQQQQQQSSQKNPQAPASQPGMGPDRKDGAVKPSAAGGPANWGSLPPHIRDALTQGREDSFSSTYKALTEKYYKKLAEEPKPGDVIAPSRTTPPMPSTAPTPASTTPTNPGSDKP